VARVDRLGEAGDVSGEHTIRRQRRDELTDERQPARGTADAAASRMTRA
jgi:hypothetical protein